MRTVDEHLFDLVLARHGDHGLDRQHERRIRRDVIQDSEAHATSRQRLESRSVRIEQLLFIGERERQRHVRQLVAGSAAVVLEQHVVRVVARVEQHHVRRLPVVDAMSRMAFMSFTRHMLGHDRCSIRGVG